MIKSLPKGIMNLFAQSSMLSIAYNLPTTFYITLSKWQQFHGETQVRLHYYADIPKTTEKNYAGQNKLLEIKTK